MNLNGSQFEQFNMDYQVFRKRAEQNGSQKMFAAGIFSDSRGKVLMVHDQQETNKLWFKLPGGVPDSSCLNNQEHFIEELVRELKKMKYSESLITAIVLRENKLNKEKKRLVPEKSLILEMVEETGYYPMEFGYVCDGYRFNKNGGKFDLWQVYFTIQKVISPNSKNLESGICHISNVKTLESLDKDVKQMRVTVPFHEAIQKLGPLTHKEALTVHFRKQERYFHANDNFETARRYAEALCAAQV
jgi:hypothetical protein